MTTDITELAQRMKTAAEKATQGEWRRASTQFNGITATPFMLGRKEVMIAVASEKRDAEFIALANPVNIRALVEALEKAQKQISRLESRSVNISVPDALNEDYDWDGQTPSEAFNTCRTICTIMFRQSLRAAGIKLEDE